MQANQSGQEKKLKDRLEELKEEKLNLLSSKKLLYRLKNLLAKKDGVLKFLQECRLS